MATPRWRALVALIFIALLAACQNRQAQLLNHANLTATVNDYLAQRGHLCLGKYDWPIVVTQADRQAHSLGAQQMAVLESLGLVTGQETGGPQSASGGPTGTAPARRYTLTPEGEKYYLHVPVVINTATQHVTHPADFCVAKLSLDRLFGWDAPQEMNGRSVTSVLFSYQIDPAPWTRTPDARRAFPLVTRAIDNARVLQLRLGVHLTQQGWVADELSQ